MERSRWKCTRHGAYGRTRPNEQNVAVVMGDGAWLILAWVVVACGGALVVHRHRGRRARPVGATRPAVHDVVVASFGSDAEAAIWAGRLEAAGIRTAITRGHGGSAYTPSIGPADVRMRE